MCKSLDHTCCYLGTYCINLNKTLKIVLERTRVLLLYQYLVIYSEREVGVFVIYIDIYTVETGKTDP